MPKIIPKEQIDEMVEMRMQGVKPIAIGAKFGLKPETVRSRLFSAAKEKGLTYPKAVRILDAKTKPARKEKGKMLKVFWKHEWHMMKVSDKSNNYQNIKIVVLNEVERVARKGRNGWYVANDTPAKARRSKIKF